ncbi:alpha/beta hydrolase, partial [Myxococcota bacterium]|nr:alpha/beta hydrolase [Myxococcota bacterium]
FGEAVALHGGVLVVGAPGQQAAGAPAAGAAHVFEREGDRWVHRLAFQPAGDDDRVAWSRVGEAVAVWGRTVVVGAPGADPGHGGAAFVIEPA